MRKRFFIDFHVERTDGDRFRRYINNLGLSEFWNEPRNERALPYLAHTFYDDDPRLEKLRELLGQQRIAWSEREEHVYTDDELRAFPLLIIGVDQEPIQGGGPEDGTEFELSHACPRCGTGAVQTSPLMIGIQGLPKKVLACETALGDILVAEPLAKTMREEEISGLELRQAHFYRNNEPLPWWQMISDYCMPKMSAATRGVKLSLSDYVERPDFVIPAQPPCSLCGRDGRFGIPEEPVQMVYSAKDVSPDEIPDVVHSWECFGQSIKDPPAGQDPRYAQPVMMVKPNVLDVFRRLRVKHSCFTPVRFVD
jgi:hypothetical protein